MIKITSKEWIVDKIKNKTFSNGDILYFSFIDHSSFPSIIKKLFDVVVFHKDRFYIFSSDHSGRIGYINNPSLLWFDNSDLLEITTDAYYFPIDN